MILGTGEPTVTIHTEKKIKRKRKGGVTVVVVTEPEDKLYRISFFKRRRLGDNTSVPLGYKQGRETGERSFLPPDHPCVMILNLDIRFHAS